MSVGERAADVTNDSQRVRPLQRNSVSCAQHPAEKRSAQQFHRNERDLAIAVEFMYPHDVRMRQRLQILKLAAQLSEQFGPYRYCCMQYLDGYVLTRCGALEAIFIDGLEHGTHAALSQDPQYP